MSQLTGIAQMVLTAYLCELMGTVETYCYLEVYPTLHVVSIDAQVQCSVWIVTVSNSLWYS